MVMHIYFDVDRPSKLLQSHTHAIWNIFKEMSKIMHQEEICQKQHFIIQQSEFATCVASETDKSGNDGQNQMKNISILVVVVTINVIVVIPLYSSLVWMLL